jgi:CRISPR/Cas system-associated endonuclease Cas1
MTAVYVKEQGAVIGRRGERLVVRKEGIVLDEIPLINVEQLVLMGNVQLTTQASLTLLRRKIDILFMPNISQTRSRLSAPKSRLGQLSSTVSIEDDLPSPLREELQAMEYLSDPALWALARSTLTTEQLAEMDYLREKANEEILTEEEEAQRKALLREYEETVLRRAHAAVLLKSRGYDLSDPTILYQP